MAGRIQFGKNLAITDFDLGPLTDAFPLLGFSCAAEEYTGYFYKDALRSQKDHIAKTWILWERATGSIAAYMSLIMDAIKLSFTEKELHNLNYPFRTIPAMKIAKLAVDRGFSEKYKGIGSFMIESAIGKALSCNDNCCAARFLTTKQCGALFCLTFCCLLYPIRKDKCGAHNEGVKIFYEKNGFIPNAGSLNKNRKTISMRKDIYC